MRVCLLGPVRVRTGVEVRVLFGDDLANECEHGPTVIVGGCLNGVT